MLTFVCLCYLPTSTCLHTYLSFFLLDCIQVFYLASYLPVFLPTSLPTCLSAYPASLSFAIMVGTENTSHTTSLTALSCWVAPHPPLGGRHKSIVPRQIRPAKVLFPGGYDMPIPRMICTHGCLDITSIWPSIIAYHSSVY